jgi:hypothetical protein
VVQFECTTTEISKQLASNRLDRCSTANPIHRSTKTVLERIRTEGFETKPSPTQSGRMRSFPLI